MNTLKPIETYYNGYRFRSQLEARWAVYFDRVGLKYQYEIEGFTLPSGHYLPDFYLPELECYVEIKPSGKPKNHSPSVYMAGRMTEPCWRPFNVYGDDDTNHCQSEFTRKEIFAERSIVYTGPFRTHLRNHSFLHGFNYAWGCNEDEIYRRSVAGIKACEVFFAFFDDLEAYGTLVEVGMARMLDKKIVVGFGREYSEVTGIDIDTEGQHMWVDELTHNLWFAAEAANQVLYGNGTKGRLKNFGDWLNREYPMSREATLAMELHHASNKAVNIFYGDPLEVIQNREWDGWVSFGGNRVYGDETAALAARQARFEHGQSN